MIAHFARHPYIERRMAQAHYDYIFVSPHLDDVVLSCSGALCSLREQGCTVLVITLFAGDPLPPFSPLAQSFHRLWKVPDEVPYAKRKEEERQAMTVLGVEYAWLGWFEILYRQSDLARAEDICDPAVDVRRDRMFSTLCHWFTDLSRAFPAAQFVVPLAVGAHRDHLVTCEAACHALNPHFLIFYEDFPYVAFQPQEVKPLARVRDLAPFHLDISPFLEKRIQATLQYQSQLEMLCHPPKRIEDVIRQYTEQHAGGEVTAVERHWIRSLDQFPLSVHMQAHSRETDAVSTEGHQLALPSFLQRE